MLTCAVCRGLLSICSEPERRDEADEREASTDTAERIRQEQEARRRMIERKLQRKCLCFCRALQFSAVYLGVRAAY